MQAMLMNLQHKNTEMTFYACINLQKHIWHQRWLIFIFASGKYGKLNWKVKRIYVNKIMLCRVYWRTEDKTKNIFLQQICIEAKLRTECFLLSFHSVLIDSNSSRRVSHPLSCINNVIIGRHMVWLTSYLRYIVALIFPMFSVLIFKR